MLRNHTQAAPEPVHVPDFHKGDEVFLAKGSYQGTLGVFQSFRPDPRWADILERDSEVRAHPVEWLDHAPVLH